MSDSDLSFTVNTASFMAGIKRLANKIGPESQRAALSIGFELMRLSQQQVPHDKGTLQNSGTVQIIGDTVVVGYHTPYAARLHEHPEYHFQKGRKGKYLLDPIVTNAKALGLKLSDEFGEGIKP